MPEETPNQIPTQPKNLPNKVNQPKGTARHYFLVTGYALLLTVVFDVISHFVQIITLSDIIISKATQFLNLYNLFWVESISLLAIFLVFILLVKLLLRKTLLSLVISVLIFVAFIFPSISLWAQLGKNYAVGQKLGDFNLSSGRIHFWFSADKKIYLINAGNAKPKVFFDRPYCGPLAGISISPDERKVLCALGRGFEDSALLTNLDTGKILEDSFFEITEPGFKESDYKPTKVGNICVFFKSWSSDSKYVLASGEDRTINTGSCSDASKLFRVDATNFNLGRILSAGDLENSTYIKDAKFSPDGSNLLVTTYNVLDKSYKFWITDSEGNNPRKIFTGQEGATAWSSDSSKILISQLFKTAVFDRDSLKEGGTVNKELTSGVYDGRNYIYYTEGTKLSRISLSTNAVELVKNLSEDAHTDNLILSPDKKSVLYEKSELVEGGGLQDRYVIDNLEEKTSNDFYLNKAPIFSGITILDWKN